MLYLLPKNWCWSKLNAVSSLITDGSHAPPPKQNSGIPMLSAQNIFNDKISFTDVRYISQQAFEKEYKRAPVEPNDVLLTIVGTIGRSTVVQPNSQRFALQRSVALIKPKLNAKYLSLFLQSPIISTYLTNKARGTAQKGIYLNQLKEIPIAIAPTNEQNRIVFKVEELFSFLDAGVSSLRMVQAQLKRYRQAVLKAAFEGKLTQQWRLAHKRTTIENKPNNGLPLGWELRRLEDVVDVQMGQSPPGTSCSPKPQGYPLLNGPTEFGARHPTPKQWTTKPTRICKKEDLLICVRGNTTGRMNWADQEYCIGRGLASLTPIKDIVNLPFVYYFLLKEVNEIMKRTTGSTFPNLKSYELKNFELPLAPFEEQKEVILQIETYFSLANQTEKTLHKTLTQASNLRQSILKNAFKGKLVAQDPTDEPAGKLLERIKTEQLNNISKNNQKELSKYVK